MTTWLIEPRDPIIFGDGRPFSADPGARSRSLAFPFPATIAGAVRTRAGRGANGYFENHRARELMERRVSGPFLVEVKQNGDVDWLFPTPADALLLNTGNSAKEPVRVVPLVPLEMPKGADTNLVEFELSMVGAEELIVKKPLPKPPAFWRWASYLDWLVAPQAGEKMLSNLGHFGPVREHRTHVSIDPVTQSNIEGAIFQTSGLEFVRKTRIDEHVGSDMTGTTQLGIVFDTDADLDEGGSFLGGQGRITFWRRCSSPLPECPDEVRRLILQQRSCRLILATPACFARGFLPSPGSLSRDGVYVSIQGVANHRYQVVSGWDYLLRKPKPSRRLVPAGSVYFVRLEGSYTAIEQWIDKLWLQSISDDEQDRRDGFGVALLGAWDGKLKELKSTEATV